MNINVAHTNYIKVFIFLKEKKVFQKKIFQNNFFEISKGDKKENGKRRFERKIQIVK